MSKPIDIKTPSDKTSVTEHAPHDDREAPTPEEVIQDQQDLEKARADGVKSRATERKPFWKHLGPGLITGAADDDPSGIGTYSVAGAQFGYALLWLTPACIPLMIAVQEMCGRVGVVTGKGLAAVIKEHYPKWLLYGAVFLLIAANVFNIYADLNVMAASAKMLFHGPFWLWLSLLTAGIVTAQILVPYRVYVRLLKWLCLALGAYVVTALLPSNHNDWGRIAHHFFVPTWRWKPDFILTIVGYLGTTISPYLFFWQAGEQVEEEIAEGKAAEPGKRLKRATEDEMRNLRADTITGMVVSQAVTFFIILCAANLHARGITDINTAQDAARALLPLGPAAYWLFTLGILGTGLLAIPTLAGSAAYAVSETAGWRYGLYRRYARAPGFYLTIAAMIIVGYLLNFLRAFSPVKALFYSSVLNGAVAVPLLVVLMLICNNPRIVESRGNGWASNLFGWLTVAFMGASVAFLIWAMATGHAS
ncbi:MAG TPA: divalent metal cation transporter [Chthonomonadaceae bacterium]|nr:divalent metal cation transporter [Chthonomonadaceae bacterium]